VQSTAGTPWSFVLQAGKRLRYTFDRLIARSSTVPNDPLVDPALFDWIGPLRDEWQAIRDEAFAVIRAPGGVPALAEVSPDHGRIAQAGRWRSFFLHGYGYAIPPNLARCPVTAAAVAKVPGLNTAFFSILAPEAHIPDHRGVSKGLMTCHLGLQVPPGNGCRMRVGDRMAGWAEGECLTFDDTYRHEVWNETDQPRIVLLIQFRRPARWPGRVAAAIFLWGVKRTRFVQEARRNIIAWDAATAGIEAA
jgi:aspartyl/asparaginyl beta-hydroxylase (cupin superfamily)